MFTPAQNEAFIGLLQDIQATGRTIGPLEFSFTRRDGRAGVCLSTLFAIPAPDGGSIYVCTDIDITDLKRAEEDRARLLAQLHFAEDAERRRIGRELHDSTAQQLAALKLNLVQMQKTLPAEASLADSIALTDQAIQEIRNFTWLLHPPLLDELGLARALADYGTGFTRRSGVRTLVETGNFSGRLAPAIELALFRVAQESLTNILRHARSQTALIRLDRDEDEVRLEIQDTGCGMNADQTHAGVGIAGMRERLRLVGGVLEVESDAEGTTIFACVPLKTNSSLLTAYPT